MKYFFYATLNDISSSSKGKSGDMESEKIWTPSDFSNIKKF